jgi:hypothetical protein
MDLELAIDRRISGELRYYVRRVGEPLLLVEDEIRECVAFVYCNYPDGKRPIGTAFFLATRIEGTDRFWVFTVTAKHLLRKIKKHSVDQRVHLRLNLRDPARIKASVGKEDLNEDTAWMDSRLDMWMSHPSDETADVAVLPIAPPDVFRFRSFDIASSATPEVIRKEGIGVGDEVFIVGLFSNHVGRARNIPIIRIGNIAAMPEERVSTENFGDIEAYLIETRSIGGLSGAPVFAHLSPVRVHDQAIKIAADGGGIFRLLGLIHGHFDVKHTNRATLTDEKINMGIAIVVPVSKIIDTINRPEVLEMKKKHAWHIKKDLLPSEDAAPEGKSSSPGVTRAEFDETLKRVSRKLKKPSAPGRAKKGT